MNKKAVGLIAALSANAIWGFTSIAFRLIKDHSADQILYYRIFLSFFICWVLILIFNRKKLKIDIQEIKKIEGKAKFKLYSLIGLSAIFITLNWYSYIYVVNYVNLKSAAFAYLVCPLITALGSFILLKEDLSYLKFIAIGLALLSIISLASGSLTDVIWSVIIALFYTLFLIIQKTIQNISKLNMLGFQLLIASIAIIPLFITYPQPVPIQFSFWLNILIVSVFFTIIPLLLSLYALKILPSSTVGILIYINPIIAFLVAFFYFHESISTNQLVAYFLLIIAILIFNYKILKELLFKISRKNLNPI